LDDKTLLVVGEAQSKNNSRKRNRFASPSLASINASSSRTNSSSTKKQKVQEIYPYTDKYANDETVLEI